MKNSMHTPGPWRAVGFSPDRVHPYVEDSEGRSICAVRARYRTMEEFKRAEADARLIASAPELLEACKAIAAYQALIESDATTGLIEAYARAFEGASAAIKKATGATS